MPDKKYGRLHAQQTPDQVWVATKVTKQRVGNTSGEYAPSLPCTNLLSSGVYISSGTIFVMLIMSNSEVPACFAIVSNSFDVWAFMNVDLYLRRKKHN